MGWTYKVWLAGMHGRGSQASAPASDAAGRGDMGGTPQTARPCRIVPRGDSRIRPTRLKSAPTRPKSGRLSSYRPYRPVSAESACIGLYWPSQVEIQKKKKKGAKCTLWLNLNTQTPSDPHTSSKTPKDGGWWYLCLIVLLIIFYFVLVSNLWVVF